MSDTTTPPPPDPSTLDPALINQLLQQTLNPQAVPVPQAQQPAASSQQGRGWVSLLGEALGGGEQYGTTQEREQGGLRALQSMGINMLAASGRSWPRRTFGEILASGMQGAQQSLAGTQAVTAAQQSALLDYQQKQQEMQLARVKEAVPLLTLLQTQQQLAAARAAAGGNQPGANTSIGAVGGGDPIAGLPKDQALAAIIQRESGGQNIPTAILGADGKPASTASGYYQMLDSTWQEAAQLAGIKNPPARAMMASRADQDAAASALFDKYGAKPWATSAPGSPKPPPAPVVAGAPQTPPAASTAPAVPPGVAQGDVAHPELAPGPPGSKGGAPVGIGAALAPPPGAPQYTVAPPPSGKGTPLPAGKLLSDATPNVDASGRVIADTRTPQEIRLGGVQVAGPGAGPSLPPSPVVATAAVPQPGWGTGAATGYNVGSTGAPPAVAVPQAAPQPIAAPPAQTPPAVQPPAGPPPDRVPDLPPPYVRGPLPAEIQAAIDHPTIDPHLIAAQNTARQGSDIKGMADATAAIGAATDKARAEALARAEAYHTAQQNIATEAWKVRRAEQAARDKQQADFQQQNATAADTHAQEERMATINNANTQLNAQRADEFKSDKTRLDSMRTDADNSRGIINTIQIMRSVEKEMPATGDLMLQKHPELINYLGPLVSEAQAKAMSGQDLYMHLQNALGTQLSQQAAKGAGSARSAEIQQNMATLPSIAMDHDGRVQMLGFLQNLAQYPINRANAAEDYYYSTPHPNAKLAATGLNSLHGFDQHFEDNGPSIIPRIAPGTSSADIAKIVKPGMLAEFPVPRIDPKTKAVMRDANNQPVYDYKRQVRE